MTTHPKWRLLGALVLAAGPLGSLANATVVAGDNAGDAVYDNGWGVGDNGGTGFSVAGWSTINNQSGAGSGGGFLASNNSESQVGIGFPAESWGLFGHSGGVGQAIRSFSSAVAVGHEFSIDMDNGSVDSGGTVGFALQNSSGNNVLEFFFVGGSANYTALGSASTNTGVGFTNQGLRLTILLTGTSTYSLSINPLSDGIGGPVTTVAGSLSNPVGGQSISRLRLFNANAGQPNANNVFFNNLAVTAVPEAAAYWFSGLAVVGYVAVALRRRELALA